MAQFDYSNAKESGRFRIEARFLRVIINILVTAIFGFAYFYIELPALNFHAGELYTFIGLMCVVYIVCSLITSGYKVETSFVFGNK